MKKLLIPIVTIILFVGCDSNQLNGPTLDTNVVEDAQAEACISAQEFATIATQLEAYMPMEVLISGQDRAESLMTTYDSERIAEILKPLKKLGLGIRNQMIRDARRTKIDLKDLNNLTEQELVILGMLHTILEHQEQTMDEKSNPNDYTILMAESSLADCAQSALGIAAFRELILKNGALNADVVLKAARKLGKRALGWVGAAIMVYEFASCMHEL